MSFKQVDQAFNVKEIIAGTVDFMISGFLMDCRARNLSPNTIRIYTKELSYFLTFLDQQGVVKESELTPEVVRLYMLALSEKRNPGGCRVAFRVVRTFTFWWEVETDGEYKSPIRKVKPPKVHEHPLEPANLSHIQKMLDTCHSDFFGARDKAIILSLLDTGCRASEFVMIDLQKPEHGAQGNRSKPHTLTGVWRTPKPG